jgi:hypothetical protein
MLGHYPIHDLIESQQKRLGLRRNELARRCGFKNLDKGLRRIDGVCHGDLDSPGAKMVLDNLAVALEVDKVVVEEAIDATTQILAEANRLAEAERDAAWREAFKPHAYLVGSENRPSQITFYGLTGGPERWLKIPLDLSQPPVTYALQAHDFVKKTPEVPFFGKTTGFIVNYTPDSAVRFDLNGDPVEHFDRAYIPGQVEVFIGKQKLPARGLFGIERENG